MAQAYVDGYSLIRGVTLVDYERIEIDLEIVRIVRGVTPGRLNNGWISILQIEVLCHVPESVSRHPQLHVRCAGDVFFDPNTASRRLEWLELVALLQCDLDPLGLYRPTRDVGSLHFNPSRYAIPSIAVRRQRP